MKNNKFKKIATIAGLAGTLSIGGCSLLNTEKGQKLVNFYKEELIDELNYYKEQSRKEKEFYKELFTDLEVENELPYEIIDVSYYYDENNELHKVTKASLIENKQERIEYIVPNGYKSVEIDGEVRVYKDKDVQKMKNSELTDETISEYIPFRNAYYDLDVYDSPDMSIDKALDMYKEYYPDIDEPICLHINYIEYTIPEGAYIIDDDLTKDGIPLYCYFDTILDKKDYNGYELSLGL